MNNPAVLFARLPRVLARTSIRTTTTRSSNQPPENVKKKKSNPSRSLGRLQGIISNMRKQENSGIDRHFKTFGHSDLFNYATNPEFSKDELRQDDLNIWSRLREHELQSISAGLPFNGFEEMIQLTEQGKLWQFPIDNEQGMMEKEVPFEDHVFLDDKLEEFPKVEFIQNLMRHVMSGLAKNPYVTVERKHEVIKFYKDYFDGKRETYKQSGIDI